MVHIQHIKGLYGLYVLHIHIGVDMSQHLV